MVLPVPAAVAGQLIRRVESAALDETLGKAQGMEVSSVHCPGFRRNTPPPTISVTGAKVPGLENSTAVPSIADRQSEHRPAVPLTEIHGASG